MIKTETEQEKISKKLTAVGLRLEEVSKKLAGFQRQTPTSRGESTSDFYEKRSASFRTSAKEGLTNALFGRVIGGMLNKKREIKERKAFELSQQQQFSADNVTAEKVEQPTNEQPKEQEVLKERMEQFMDAITKSMNSVNERVGDVDATTKKISGIVTAIQQRVSPRDVQLKPKKEGESATTVRYDPMAPSGKQYSKVGESGKAIQFASKKETQRAGMSLSRTMPNDDKTQPPDPSDKADLPDPSDKAAMAAYGKKLREDRRKEETDDINRMLAQRKLDLLNNPNHDRDNASSGEGIGPPQESADQSQEATATQIDIAKEDPIAERLGKVEEKVDEILEKMDKGSFLKNLLSAIPMLITTLVPALLKSLGNLASLVVGTIMKNPQIVALVAAFAGGFMVGEWLNENTKIQEYIKTTIDWISEAMKWVKEKFNSVLEWMGLGDSEEDMGEKEKTQTNEMVKNASEDPNYMSGVVQESSKRVKENNNALQQMNSDWVAEIGDEGNTVYRKKGESKEYSTEEFQKEDNESFNNMVKIKGENKAATAESAPQQPAQRERVPGEIPAEYLRLEDSPASSATNNSYNRSSAIPQEKKSTGDELDVRSSDLAQKKTVPTTMQPIVINQKAAAPQQMKQQKEGPGTLVIKTRHMEPSLATYRASVFDHPVTHPGNYLI